MDKSLKELESRLEGLVPRGLSNEGHQKCSTTIEKLASGEFAGETQMSVSKATMGLSWRALATSAAAALTVGLGCGLWLGQSQEPAIGQVSEGPDALASAFELIEQETWRTPEEQSKIYLSANGELRELSTEVETTQEVVKHRESGQTVTIERNDYLEVDSAKQDF